MTADGGTEGVGLGRDPGVVVATLSVVIANVILVKLIQLVGQAPEDRRRAHLPKNAPGCPRNQGTARAG